MNWTPDCRWLFVLFALVLASCGGSGGATSPSTPALTAVALSPLTAALAPGGTIQLTVTGSYRDGSTANLPAAGEVFQSSNTAMVTVNVDGLAAAASNATAGVVVTITATNSASGLTTSVAHSTAITISTIGLGPPTPNSAAAVAATAQNNAMCTAIQPFYWVIGDSTGALSDGSSTQADSTAVTATTRFPIASASKWIYGMYVVQQRGGAANLTPADIAFLTFTSGYTYMGSVTESVTCTPPSSGANSINYCLTLPSTTPGEFFNGQDSSTVGLFDYDSGHEENHAGQFQPEINALDASDLGSAIATGLGVSGITLRYNQPLLAGGIYASANDYSAILRAVLTGQLYMRDALGTHAVCAWTGSGCNAANSPQFREHWHYSIGHWVEDDASQGDDGAFSSAGAFGFYPWIASSKKYYGVISRHAPSGTGDQNGFASAKCGRQLRAAWESGVQQ